MITTISIPEKYVDFIDFLVKNGEFKTRSMAIRKMVDDYIKFQAMLISKFDKNIEIRIEKDMRKTWRKISRN